VSPRAVALVNVASRHEIPVNVASPRAGSPADFASPGPCRRQPGRGERHEILVNVASRHEILVNVASIGSRPR
jgi:hypothetical protein